MRILVGTLYTIENEYEECLESIKQQTFNNYDHITIRDLPNKEAHTTLFKIFLDQADKYDVLIKIDADMVLSRHTLLEEIVQKLEANKWADILSISVHDFFSDQLIWGLNAFRNTVRWDFRKKTLFVDRPEVNDNKYLFDNNDLAPAAIHCKNPSKYQAFHFGVHRGLKVIQSGSVEQNETSSKSQMRILELTWRHFLKTNDLRLGLASLGAELAYRNTFSADDLNYSNQKMHDVLNKYKFMDNKNMETTIKKLRLFNFSFLSKNRRRKILKLLYR